MAITVGKLNKPVGISFKPTGATSTIQTALFFERLTTSVGILNINTNINNFFAANPTHIFISSTLSFAQIEGGLQNYICAQVYFYATI